MTTAGTKTLAQLRFEVRSRTDALIQGVSILPTYPDPYAAAGPVNTTELNSYINSSYNELYDLMVNTFGNYYFTSTFQITTANSQEQYPLPLDHLKLLGVEWVQTPGTNLNNVTLKTFQIRERNLYTAPFFLTGPYTMGSILYAEFGTNIWFKPQPPNGQVIQLLYVPLPLYLSDTGTITLTNVVAGDYITFNGTRYTAAVYGSSPTSSNFIVGGTGSTNLGDAGTAASLATQLQTSFFGYPGGQNGGTLTAVAANNVVNLTFPANSIITWAVSNGDMALWPNYECYYPAQTLGITFSTTMQGYSGWWEYIVVDAAIKVKQKQDLDTSVLERQKAALIRRIQAACDNRDASAPRRITDVYGTESGYGPFGYGRPY